MSDLKRKALSFLQRFESSDYNRQIEIGNRNLQEAMRHALGVDRSLSGVVSGLVVSVVPSTMQVTITNGLGILYDASQADPNSPYRWIELMATAIATVATSDPTNPRWDVVEIEPGSAGQDAVPADFWNESLNDWDPGTAVVEYDPAPTITIRSGTPAGSPALPGGIAGRVPLAYIYVPANASTIATDAVVLCRPLLRSPGADEIASQNAASGSPPVGAIWGGGVSAAGGSRQVSLIPARGRFAGHRANFLVGAVTFTPSASYFDGGSLPAADGPVYFYAAPVPYPSGYSATLAPREFSPGASARAAFGAGAPTNTVGCLVVASEQAPVFSFQGPSVGTGSIVDPAFGSGSISMDRTQWVYLGAAQYDQSEDDFVAQTIQGEWVRPAWVTTPDPAITALGVAAIDLRASAGTGQIPLPTTTGQILISLGVVFDSTGQHISVEIQDDPGGATEVDFYEFGPAANSIPPSGSFNRQAYRMVVTPVSGQITAGRRQLSGTPPDPTAKVVAYQDRILALR